jgi:hypothetical protein
MQINYSTFIGLNIPYKSPREDELKMKKDLDKGERREIKNLTVYTRLYSTRISMLASITSRSRLPETRELYCAVFPPSTSSK